ncbi:MAG: SOS response-associated peptidase [Defluviitaleaceae bacterium]|nr:SOS response-associated peptidase [Defluviitaleaceae bacterium]
MCGRYSAPAETDIIAICGILHDISLGIINDDFLEYVKTDDEVRPTNHAPVITCLGNGTVSLQDMRWGFKKWDGKGGPVINARVETLTTKSMFAPLLKVGRMVVPANEYYEWKNIGRDKIKYSIKDAGGNALFMAGLYREGDDGREFVIITKDANEGIAEIHKRMPVILHANQIADWLTGKLSPDDIKNLDFNALLTPWEGALVQLSLE